MRSKRFFNILLLSLFTVLFASSFSFARRIPYVKRTRHSVDFKKTRVVLDLSGKVYKKNIKSYIKNNYLVFIINNLRTDKKTVKLKARHSEYVELIPLTKKKIKVRIKLDAPHSYKIFALNSNRKSRKPFRLVIDVYKDFINTKVATKKKVKVKSIKKIRDEVGQWIVVLDPGHGGRDPGAVWPIRWRYPKYKEKKITLSIAKKVKALLEKDKNIKVIMTRNTDRSVPLLKRAEIAAKSCADVFVSIHADSMPSHPSWSGVTVFKASPSLFAKAQSTARAIAKNVKLCSDSMCWSITPVLVSLSSTVTFVESRKLGESIVKSLKANSNEKIVKGIKDMKRNILVLKTPGRPAVLVETGFMTNKTDRKKLVSSKYQWKIARGIAEGIKKYFYSRDKVALY